MHPTRNPSFTRAAKRYRHSLSDVATFDVRTLKELLDAEVLPSAYADAFGLRYLG